MCLGLLCLCVGLCPQFYQSIHPWVEGEEEVRTDSVTVRCK